MLGIEILTIDIFNSFWGVFGTPCIKVGRRNNDKMLQLSSIIKKLFKISKSKLLEAKFQGVKVLFFLQNYSTFTDIFSPDFLIEN